MLNCADINTIFQILIKYFFLKKNMSYYIYIIYIFKTKTLQKWYCRMPLNRMV